MRLNRINEGFNVKGWLVFNKYDGTGVTECPSLHPSLGSPLYQCHES